MRQRVSVDQGDTLEVEKKILVSVSALNFRILGFIFDEIVWVKQMTNEIDANWAWRAIN